MNVNKAKPDLGSKPYEHNHLVRAIQFGSMHEEEEEIHYVHTASKGL